MMSRRRLPEPEMKTPTTNVLPDPARSTHPSPAMEFNSRRGYDSRRRIGSEPLQRRWKMRVDRDQTGHRSPPSGITRHDFGSGAGHARRARSPAAVSATEEPILPPGHLPAQEGEVEDGCQFVAETPGAGATPRLVSARTRGVREPRRGPSQH